ncbi:MAG: acyl carrier protein [Rickettsiales bacterium]|nr:acyl carrier protein [Rickettsiales bacterium]
MTIEELIASTLKIARDRVSDATTMKDVAEWDSLKHMELILNIERHFSVELTGDEIADMVSVKAIKHILGQRGVCK